MDAGLWHSVGGGGGVLTQHGEGKILIQLWSGFDGFWLGSTPRLAGDS